MKKNLPNSTRLRQLGLLFIPIFIMSCSLLSVNSLSATVEPTRVLVESIPPTAQPENVETISQTTTDTGESLVLLYRQVNPAVVNIKILDTIDGSLEEVGDASGFVFDNQGNIVTNAHVVHGVSGLDVIFADGTIRTAEIIGIDLHSDLAVIKVDELPAGIPALPLGDMSTVAVGQTVIAIGNPFGLGGTLTRGVISALGRTIPGLTNFRISQAIQTDAAINPGNSGGPLLNLQGQVIGVNDQIQTDGNSRSNSGVGFAVPVSIVAQVIPDLIATGNHAWPWLGVTGADLSVQQAKAMGLPVEQGAYLSGIIENGPADKASLRGSSDQQRVDQRVVEVGGDVIVQIDDQRVNSFDDLINYVMVNGTPGQVMRLQILREGEYQTVEITLEARPSTSDS